MATCEAPLPLWRPPHEPAGVAIKEVLLLPREGEKAVLPAEEEEGGEGLLPHQSVGGEESKTDDDADDGGGSSLPRRRKRRSWGAVLWHELARETWTVPPPEPEHWLNFR